MDKPRTITVDDVMAENPCWDRTEIEAAFDGRESVSAREVAESDRVSEENRIWVLTSPLFMNNRTARIFAMRCAREALALVEIPDPRSVAACDVAERYAKGKPTNKKLHAAALAAEAAYYSVASSEADRMAAVWVQAKWAAYWAAYWTGSWSAQLARALEMVEEQDTNEKGETK